MKKTVDKNTRRKRRKLRKSHIISGTNERPRVSVFRSNTKIYIQAIDDEKGITLASTFSSEKERSKVKQLGESFAKLFDFASFFF